MSSVGRYPCVLYNFILGNRQQATVVLRQAKTAWTTPPRRSFLSVLSKRSCVSNFPKENQVTDIVLGLHAKFHVPKCSLTPPELLL